jgi:hypothetical protein
LYASSLARNTLQALVQAALGILFTSCLLYAGYWPAAFIGYPLWCGSLGYLICVPVMAVALTGLAYRNYKRVFLDWKVWRENVLVLATSLVLAASATGAIYHRSWELLAPIEPPHGAARLTAQQTQLQNRGACINVFLPDGRVWLKYFIFTQPDPLTSSQEIKFGGGRFLDGTNWLDVDSYMGGIVGIQRDGSLWISEKPAHWRMEPNGEISEPEPSKLIRAGNGNDWKKVFSSNGSCFLLKNDGTLWWVGYEPWTKYRKGDKKGVQPPWFSPQQLGSDSDWAEIIPSERRPFFRKKNGEVWGAEKANSGKILVFRVPGMESKCNSVISCLSNHESFRAGVCEDGSFRELGNSGNRDVQIGTETNWLTAVSFWRTTVTLRADGTLWEWKFETLSSVDPHGCSMSRFSQRSDWVGLTEVYSGLISLAADGSLWMWRLETPYSGLFPMLAESRKPRYIGNIFSGPPRTP